MLTISILLSVEAFEALRRVRTSSHRQIVISPEFPRYFDPTVQADDTTSPPTILFIAGR